MSAAAAGPFACDQLHQLRRVVLTGGPGAGKTAVLELVRATACRHVRVLPEAASVIFGGGFPRRDGFDERRAAPRAIFHVQRELEALGEAEGPPCCSATAAPATGWRTGPASRTTCGKRSTAASTPN